MEETNRCRYCNDDVLNDLQGRHFVDGGTEAVLVHLLRLSSIAQTPATVFRDKNMKERPSRCQGVDRIWTRCGGRTMRE